MVALQTQRFLMFSTRSASAVLSRHSIRQRPFSFSLSRSNRTFSRLASSSISDGAGNEDHQPPLLQYGGHSARAFFSTSSAAVSPSAVDRIGLGSHKWYHWYKTEPSRYPQILQTSFELGVTTVEAGQEGGDLALAEAYRSIVQQNPELLAKKVTILFRIGYRTILPPNVNADLKDLAENNNNDSATCPSFLPQDVQVEEQPYQPSSKGGTVSVGEDTPKLRVVHNIGPKSIQSALDASPLTRLKEEFSDSIELVPLLNNPEVQATLLAGSTIDERQFRIQQRLTEAFVALEEQVTNGAIASYGVVSNGICLPNNHPLYLNHKTVLTAATDARDQLKKERLSFSVIQLPVNVLETTGIQVAKAIKSSLAEEGASADKEQSLQVYAMRPLTCYPDRGTGEGKPFILADYMLPATMEKKLQWTNEMEAPPAVYEVALKTAFAHFDAEEIIQAKVEGKELTSDQRETLDGCKLLQSLLHDLDLKLSKIRSYAAHESDLSEKIIPLIHDTFEAYDDETARMLQSFFGAYSLAVRYAIARNTRKLLRDGESGSNVPAFDSDALPQEMRLQEFGLRFVLEQKDDLFAKVMVGYSQPEHVIDTVSIVEKILLESKEAVSNENDMTTKE